MARDPRHDILFEPVRIGPKVLRNRFYQVPHCTGFGTDRPGTQARFRAMKAEGGWAAVNTELCSIHAETDRAPRIAARLWDDDDARNLALMCDEAHAHGALAGVELWHGGPSAEGSQSREVPGGPSQIPSDYNQLSYPREMDEREIREVQSFYAKAAVRARDAGFDIIYIYGAHSFLPLQFLSPYYNKRTDRYGGSLENRARFWIETLEQVRAAVGSECAIAARLAVDARGPNGIGIDEGLAFIRLADHLVDLWDVNIGSMADLSADLATSRLAGEGWQLPWTGRVREATLKPIVGVGRLTNPDRMAEIIRSGVWDLIGAARPSIADPFLPRKIEEGRYEDIRECIGCNICLARALNTLQIACTQNATAGEEYRRGWHPERFEHAANANRDVLVVGAGAAGMECAMVLGKRGMRRVHLVEAEPEIGGYVARVSRLPGLHEWARVVNYRRIQLGKLRNVEVHTGVRLDLESARSYGAEIVIAATGARWAADGLNHVTHAPIPGADLPHVVTPERILEGESYLKHPLPSHERNASGDRHGAGVMRTPAPPQRGRENMRTLVYDCEGYFMGVGMAELLASRGARLTLVTPLPVIAPFLDQTDEGPRVRQRLVTLGVELIVETELTAIAEASCQLRWYGKDREVAADRVILVTARVSNDALYRALIGDQPALERAGVEAVYRIGDCVAPRLIADCVFDGHRLAREIDAPDPRRPRPYLRERPVLAPSEGRPVAAVER